MSFLSVQEETESFPDFLETEIPCLPTGHPAAMDIHTVNIRGVDSVSPESGFWPVKERLI